MRLVVALLCGTILFSAGSAVAGPIPASAIATNKTRFRIPFKFDAAEMQALGAREVRLFVSQDRGATWQHQQTVAPDAGKFQFQAPADGEYWFVVRTLDSQNRLHPEGAGMEPGLVVIVDTAQPQLRIELRQPQAGRVQLAWAATDRNLDLTQLRLEYIQPGQPEWKPIVVVPKAMGQTDWSVPAAGLVAVRGTIGDTAKNTVTAETQLRVQGALNAVPQPESPTARHPVAGMTPPNAVSAPMLAPVDSPSLAAPDAAPAIIARPVSRSQSPLLPVPPLTSPPSAEGEFRTLIREGSVAASPTQNPASPGAARARVIAARRFNLGYTVQDIGPSGLGGVEIYATDNGGANWYRYGEDPDRQSPAAIELPGEGTYGFTIVARSGAGLSADPPQNGQAPSMALVVDLTPPNIELTGLEQGRGTLVNKIAVSWRYHDANPHDAPVQISWSVNGQDGWQSVSGWVENSGRYLWNIAPNTPPRFFVRIEARDLAGNVRSAVTPQAVLIDLSRPTARILDIETAEAHP